MLVAVAAILYLSLPAAFYNFDGVACAIAVELGDLRHLAHGNHLGYGLLGYLWFSIWKALGYEGPALHALQALSSILGAAGVGAFAHLLLRCGFTRTSAVMGGLGLMVSEIYWRWSLEAQVYPLGALFLFLAAAEIFAWNEGFEGRAILAGFLHAGAVIGHIGHVMFVPMVLYLAPNHTGRRKYLLALASALIAAYVMAGCLFIRVDSWRELKVWLLGSAALSVEQAWKWHGGGYGLDALRAWGQVSLRLFGGGAWVGACFWAAAAWGGWKAWRQYRRNVAACIMWLASYGALYLSWEPYTPVYRITDLAPLWLLILFCFAGTLQASREDAASKARVEVERRIWKQRAPAMLLAAAILLLGSYNLRRTILRLNRPENNPDLQRALRLARQTPPDAWVVSEGVDEVYIPYFAHRKPLILRYYAAREETLERRLRSLISGGQTVFAVPASLSPRWRSWFLPWISKTFGEPEISLAHPLRPPSR